MSQTDLGKALGVSYQQIWKYENGKNRLGASRLQQIANVLNVAPDFFFEGELARVLGNSGSKEAALIQDFISSPDGIGLSKAFTNISDAKLRRSIVALVRQIAEL